MAVYDVQILAQRSAVVVKEFRAFIDDSVSTVEVGRKLVNDAGSTMYEAVESVKRMTEIVGAMATSISEQVEGIEPINIVVSDMGGVTWKNATLVEQEAAATISWQDQVNQLVLAVNVFRFNPSARGDLTRADREAEFPGCPSKSKFGMVKSPV